jgi:DNA-binding GntR family transcriptional regulator
VKKATARPAPRTRRPVRTDAPRDDDLTRQGRAYEAIRQGILDAHYAGGTLLSEYELARRIGVSRTPIREALSRLQQEGLVRSVARRGTFVAELTARDIIEIYELREQLEVFAAGAAAERMDMALAEELRDELDAVRAAPRVERIAAAREEDVHLHKQIIAAASNGRLTQILSTLDDQVHRIRFMALSGEPRIDATLGEHAGIIDAIIRRDREAAGEAMRRHLQAARQNAIQLSLGGKPLPAASR